MKKRGFTLIELLAVVVVLAVIALITVPLLLNVIDKAKKGAAKASALNYVDAVEKYMVLSQLDNTKIKLVPGKVYQINRSDELSFIDLIIPKVYAEDEEIYLNDIVTVKGEKPDKGWVIVSDKKVENYSFVENGFVVTKDQEISKGNEPVDPSELGIGEIELKGNPIGEYAQSLLDNNTTYGNYTYMNGEYLKGIQPNNYVWYNGFMWRIMGKNSGGTIRLITEENITSIAWGANGEGLSPAFNLKDSYINDFLNSGTKYSFYGHLNDTRDVIQDETWCINPTSDYLAKRTNCTGGTTYSAKVGLITLDEYNLNGASSTNNSYYLVNGQNYWMLTPYNASSTWLVAQDGNSGSISGCVGTRGIRPIINVNADAIITTGNGTASNPYMLQQSNVSIKNKTLNQKATTGEYVQLSGKTYRVVSKENGGVKLILDGYYEATSGTVTTSKFGTSTEFKDSIIDKLLNDAVLTWLNSDKIIDTDWNQGSVMVNGSKYTQLLENNGTNVTRKVGLIRLGEMLSGQSSSVLTKNYTVASNFNNAKPYWLMTPGTIASYIGYVQNIGNFTNGSIDTTYAVRPVIFVASNTNITSGNGTPSSPYIID